MLDLEPVLALHVYDQSVDGYGRKGTRCMTRLALTGTRVEASHNTLCYVMQVTAHRTCTGGRKSTVRHVVITRKHSRLCKVSESQVRCCRLIWSWQRK